MTLWQAIVLAVVQGVTEFLPISSTAHLVLVPWLLGWQDPGLTFDVALHAGTLVAVLLYFAREWTALLTGAFRAGMHRLWAIKAENPFAGELNLPRPSPLPRSVELNANMLLVIAAATLPGALAGYFLESYAETGFRRPALVAAALIAVALLMWVADRRRTLVRRVDSIGLADGVIIGLAQAVAIIPGTSRAGITIAAGMFRNLTREAAARFSFLLAAPIIAGATAKEGLDLLRDGLPAGTSAADFAVGFVVSAAVGYAAIAFLLRYLEVRTLKIFVAYRLAWGVIILAVEFLRSSA
ncbi:MAG: undecaprenyl-diphosphate phosphatase [Acidobacteria bacterium]|nr:undecaprenyl-diphosphate phosphatase [Acidobacteriota bacterium]